MFFYEGYVCPVCKNKFNINDDIVACPDCGAPHHRDCWKQSGKCVYSDDHGTPRQWKRVEEPSSTSYSNNVKHTTTNTNNQTRTCSKCGKINPQFAEFCSRCGFGLNPPDWRSAEPKSQSNQAGQQHKGFTGGYGEYTPFHMPIVDPFGGVARDEKIDGVAADDLVTFIGPNSSYYIPRFHKMSHSGTQTSWNWVAFFFTPYWLLYRKNYLAGSIVLFLSLISSFINSYILQNFIGPALDMSSDSAMIDSLYNLIQSGRFTIYFSIISLLFIISLLVRIIFGLIGNNIYKKTAINRIKRISEKTGMNRIYNESAYKTSIIADYRRELSVQGGVSLVLVAVASGIVWFGQMLYSALFLI
jgi:ribosomal protein L40E